MTLQSSNGDNAEILRDPGFDSQTTPYSRTEEELSSLINSLVADPSVRYIDSTTNPDIGNFVVYKVDGRDPRADAGRNLENKIFSDESGYEPGFIESNFAPYDSNSTFMILVDPTDQNDQKAVGALRIIDCAKGGSETVSMFKEFYPDRPLPPELIVQEGEDLWDILTIVMEPKYRNGVNSAWLYHALYRLSAEEDVNNWIANVTPHEMRNLRDYIGIPFLEIPGVDEVVDVVDGKESVYGFYTIDVSSIAAGVSKQVNKLELDAVTEVDPDLKATYELFAKVARIAFLGK